MFAEPISNSKGIRIGVIEAINKSGGGSFTVARGCAVEISVAQEGEAMRVTALFRWTRRQPRSRV